MVPVLSLPPAETEVDRDFTRLYHTHDDLRVLAVMARRVIGWVTEQPQPPRERVCLKEPAGREFSLLVNGPEALVASSPLTLVGFFGQHNPDATTSQRQALWEIDEVLLGEVSEYPGVLSLSCLELEDGNFANLVLLADQEAADHWRAGPTHQRAVREHAPVYYRSIRIHNGTLLRGELSLEKTKYYEFGFSGPWFAQRDFHPALTRPV